MMTPQQALANIDSLFRQCRLPNNTTEDVLIGFNSIGVLKAYLAKKEVSRSIEEPTDSETLDEEEKMS